MDSLVDNEDLLANIIGSHKDESSNPEKSNLMLKSNSVDENMDDLNNRIGATANDFKKKKRRKKIQAITSISVECQEALEKLSMASGASISSIMFSIIEEYLMRKKLIHR
jgi:glycosylphosphatidylinositol transamidase (GPIT) subunit GPI8